MMHLASRPALAAGVALTAFMYAPPVALAASPAARSAPSVAWLACPTCGKAKATPAAGSEAFKWPPWLSIEWPINPFDHSIPGAVFYVHTAMHNGTPTVRDLSGAAEGMVNGQRRTVPLHFDATPTPGVFAVRAQWPTQGAWLIRITLGGSTTALVSLDGQGNVASVRVPTRVVGDQTLPRQVAASEIDSTLTQLAARHQ